MSSLPSGIRLVALLNEHLNEIMERERMNLPRSTYIVQDLIGWLSSVRPTSCIVRSRIARPHRCACSPTRSQS